jgi:hypothetical protein
MKHLLCVYASLFVITALPADNPLICDKEVYFQASLYTAHSPRHGITEWFSIEPQRICYPDPGSHTTDIIVLHGETSNGCEASFTHLAKETWRLSYEQIHELLAADDKAKLFVLFLSLANDRETVRDIEKIQDECCVAYP